VAASAVPTVRPAVNRFLASLSQADARRLEPLLASVEVRAGEVLHSPDAGYEHAYVYFPTSCLISLLYSTREGASVEVAVVGTDGLVGDVAAHTGAAPTHHAVVQIGGQALRIGPAVLRAQAAASESLRRALWCYTYALMTQIVQISVCNTVHPLHQRLCRWILVCRDRLGIREIPATQEMIARLLAVRRESVSHAAVSLQTEGLVRYVRGHVQIVDAARMEAAVCECHGVIRDAYAHLVEAMP